MKFRKRRVTIDTNVFISGIVYGTDTAKKAIEKSTTKDKLMLTDVIYVECVKSASKEKHGKAGRDMDKELQKLRSKLIKIDLPADVELKRIYYIRDENDYKIVYSADATKSNLLVTGDKDFFDPKLKGPRAKIIKPVDYVKDEKKKKKSRRKP